MTNLQPGYYYFRYKIPNSTAVRFWDGSNWRFAQDGVQTDYPGDRAVEVSFLAPPQDRTPYAYYGEPKDKTVYAKRHPRTGDTLCDGHQMHYEWNGWNWE